jgi:drug/metabolite transporter (DMT)-like permease
VQRSLRKLSTGGGIGAIVLWSTTFAFARSLSEQVGPLTAGAAAYLIGGVFSVIRLGRAGKPFSRILKLPRQYLLGCGCFFLLYTAAIYVAVGLAKDREQVLEVALINYLWPTLTILFSLPLLKMRSTFWLVPGTALALVGVFLVVTQGAHVTWNSWWEHLLKNPAAYVLALVAAVSWALYSNLTRRWSEPDGDGAVDLFVPATGLVLLAMRLVVTEPTGWSLRTVAEASGLGIVTMLAYVLWEVAMRKGDLLFVAACSYFTPFLSTLVSCAYLKVSPSPKLWIGCLLLVSGSLVTWRSVSERALPRK